MEPNIKEVAARIRALREDLDLTLQEMAEATGRTTAEYAAQESGEEDLSFTFLYKCADKFGVEFHPGEKPWGVKADVIMPSAMQNDVHMEHAKQIVANGVKYYIEVANMPTTNDALFYLMEQKNMIVAPSKAVNAGGVAVSALEMSQNSERLVWTAEEVDAQLHKMMENIHRVSMEAAEEYGLGYNLVAGANLAGFKKVAEAMMEQGIF